MASMQPVPGILTVNSGVIKPVELSQAAFDSWYCDEHIPEVVAKSGISHAYRYEHVDNGASPARRLNFLTIYGMDDINFTRSDEFKGLEGQRPGPSRERIFDKSEFDTRSYELVQVEEAAGTTTSGKITPQLHTMKTIDELQNQRPYFSGKLCHTVQIQNWMNGTAASTLLRFPNVLVTDGRADTKAQLDPYFQPSRDHSHLLPSGYLCMSLKGLRFRGKI